MLFPILAQAITLDNPLQATSFEGLINTLIDIIFTMALVIAPIMIIVAGFYLLTAAGNPAQITTAKNIIMWTLIGFLVILAAKGIIELFKAVFLPPPDTH